jgi:16S rRNA C1402 N4-methylase RsmH
MEIITRKGITASKEEQDENKRSACARLRVAEKLI